MRSLPNLLVLTTPLLEHFHRTHKSRGPKHGAGVDLIADQMDSFGGYEIKDKVEFISAHCSA